MAVQGFVDVAGSSKVTSYWSVSGLTRGQQDDRKAGREQTRRGEEPTAHLTLYLPLSPFFIFPNQQPAIGRIGDERRAIVEVRSTSQK